MKREDLLSKARNIIDGDDRLSGEERVILMELLESAPLNSLGLFVSLFAGDPDILPEFASLVLRKKYARSEEELAEIIEFEEQWLRRLAEK